MASRADVERNLGIFLGRLTGNEDRVRSALPTPKVIRCHITDLDADWFAVVADGRVSPPSPTAPDSAPDITLSIGSDDLVEMVEGRLSLMAALASRRAKVDASIGDLLRLRSLA